MAQPISSRSASLTNRLLTEDPDWYRDAVIYEVYVRSFCDSNGDGIGDFPGLTSKLDYLADLGVTALWVLPFYPSPLKDGGYDISDYSAVHPDYGTLEDFQRFLDEAHARGLRVITELVINHTSAQHPWFQRARRAAKGSPERDFYVFSDDSSQYKDARIIFRDFEKSNWTWDPVAEAYYWHRFYGHQPDLNFDNPAVHDALLEVLDHWLNMGVDGLRLDAIPYLYEREGTNCENLDETHGFLKKLRAHVDERFKGRMLLAEANQWPADAASYFGDGDECHMNFHFPLMPRLFMSVQLEDSFPIIDILEQTPAIPEGCQWATFLRNHDELTLEMVTEEDRDYMYRVYAKDRRARINLGIRRRLAPLMGGDRRRIELLNALLFSLPGTPVLYYGDEIGMGDNYFLGDRDGVRTPMQWNADRNAGFSRANPQQLYLPVVVDPEYHYSSVNVEAQQANPSSLLWFTKHLIALQRSTPVFSRGTITFIEGDNHKIIAFVRELAEERILFVGNLSRYPQHVRLQLESYAGSEVIEALGRSKFPRAGEDPYALTLAPYGTYWLVLKSAGAEAEEQGPLRLGESLSSVMNEYNLETLLQRLESFLERRRWYRGKGRQRRAVRIRDVFEMRTPDEEFSIIALGVDYVTGDSEIYLLPLAFAGQEQGRHVMAQYPDSVVCSAERQLTDGTVSGVLYDALRSPAFARSILANLAEGTTLVGREASMVFLPSCSPEEAADWASLTPHAMELDQTNSVVFFGNQLVLKVMRAIDEGPSAEQEVGEFVSRRSDKRLVPRVFGAVALKEREGESLAAAVLTEYLPNRGTAWELTVEAIQTFYDRVLVQSEAEAAGVPELVTLLPAQPSEVPPALLALIEPYTAWAELLAQRTADLHRILASDSEDPVFGPEAFTTMHRQSIYQRARAHLGRTMDALARGAGDLAPELRERVLRMTRREREVDARFKRINEQRFQVDRIRCHGDYHLGQVLFSGDDFYLIDFEGEPARTARERRAKRCALRDVAGMIRSFDYAVESTLRMGRIRAADVERLRPWGKAWGGAIASIFVEAYLEAMQGTTLIPDSRVATRELVSFYLFEKCVYEVAYEFDNRPDWLAVPLAGLEGLLDSAISPARSGSV